MQLDNIIITEQFDLHLLYNEDGDDNPITYSARALAAFRNFFANGFIDIFQQIF